MPMHPDSVPAYLKTMPELLQKAYDAIDRAFKLVDLENIEDEVLEEVTWVCSSLAAALKLMRGISQRLLTEESETIAVELREAYKLVLAISGLPDGGSSSQGPSKTVLTMRAEELRTEIQRVEKLQAAARAISGT